MNKVHCRPEFTYIHLYPEDSYDVGKSLPSSSASRDQSSPARKWKAAFTGNREDSSGAGTRRTQKEVTQETIT